MASNIQVLPLPRSSGDGSDSSIPTNLPGSLAAQDIRQLKDRFSERLPESSSPKRAHNDDELHDFYVGNKTAITRAKKQKLVELYAYLIGGEIKECEKLKKDHLLELICDLVSYLFHMHQSN